MPRKKPIRKASSAPKADKGRGGSEPGAIVQRTPQDEARIAIRRTTVFKMLLEGYSYREISSRLEIAQTTAWQDAQTELQALRDITTDMARQTRDMELERLQLLTRHVMPHCLNRKVKLPTGAEIEVAPDPKMLNQLLKIMERRAKLMGLDAPEVKASLSIPWGDFTDDDMARVSAGADIREIIIEIERRKAEASKPKPPMKMVGPKMTRLTTTGGPGGFFEDGE